MCNQQNHLDFVTNINRITQTNSYTTRNFEHLSKEISISREAHNMMQLNSLTKKPNQNFQQLAP